MVKCFTAEQDSRAMLCIMVPTQVVCQVNGNTFSCFMHQGGKWYLLLIFCERLNFQFENNAF